MKKEELLKIREKLHKEYVKLLMNSGYQLPTYTRSQAEIKWIDVYVAFNSAFNLHESDIEE